jgi:hypothetical protein
MFSKLKMLLRKASERIVEALWSGICELLGRFPPNECENYFKPRDMDQPDRITL